MTDVELRDELMTMLAAGHETTATGLAWAFDLLLHNPAPLARLRDELDGDDDAYLDAVVTETLRLRPVIDAAERTLKAPRTIAGWDLPAGIRVYPAIAMVHRREDLYPNARAFRPERFLDGGREVLHLAAVRRRDPALHRRRARPGRDGRGAAGGPRARRARAGEPAHRPGGAAAGSRWRRRDGVRMRVTRRATPSGATRQAAAAVAA